MAKKMKTYRIMGRLRIETYLPIEALSLEDALEKSKTLTEADFVEIYGDYCDGGLTVYGVFSDEEGKWLRGWK